MPDSCSDAFNSSVLMLKHCIIVAIVVQSLEGRFEIIVPNGAHLLLDRSPIRKLFCLFNLLVRLCAAWDFLKLEFGKGLSN